ncbi:MAG: adenosylmethionine decarboxylase [Thermoprotei archaeon]|nr:MAG: adenosylmethionine decarboxylase [Thermoprotei archaeon]
MGTVALWRGVEEVGDDYVVGRHVYANLYGVKEEVLSNEELVREIAVEAAREARMTIVDVRSWSFGGRKGGVSVIVLVNESHIAIHTWVEYRYATVDIYTCGEQSDPWRAFEVVVKRMKPLRTKVGYADRSSNTI